MVIEKIVFVEKPVAEAAPAKKRAPHLRAVPSPISLPFFDEEPGIDEKPAPVKPGLAAEERYKLKTLLGELEGLKRRLKTARRGR